MDIDEWVKWLLVVSGLAFVLLAWFTWKGYARYRGRVRELSSRLGGAQVAFTKIAQEVSGISEATRKAVTAQDVDSAFSAWMGRLVRKTVVRKRG